VAASTTTPATAAPETLPGTGSSDLAVPVALVVGAMGVLLVVVAAVRRTASD